MNNETLADALEAAENNTLPLHFTVHVPHPDTLSDLLSHIQEIHNSLVDAGCVSVGFPHAGVFGEDVLF